MAFPTPWIVQHLAWQAGGTDAHGNPAPTYAAAVDVLVYGWASPEPEERTSERVVVDLKVYAPPAVSGASEDQWVVDGQTYEQQGPVQDYNHGPFGWRPGVVINLRRVEG